MASAATGATAAVTAEGASRSGGRPGAAAMGHAMAETAAAEALVAAATLHSTRAASHSAPAPPATYFGEAWPDAEVSGAGGVRVEVGGDARWRRATLSSGIELQPRITDGTTSCAHTVELDATERE